MIEDDELIRIASFKLNDTAKRIAALANKADSPRIMARLMALSAPLRRLEKETRALVSPQLEGSVSL